MFDDSKYEELIGKYQENKYQRDQFDSMMKEISNQIDQMLHEDKLNEKKVFVTSLNDFFEVKYIDRKTKSVDYVLLAEMISDDLYNQIVQEKETTYLKINKAPKAKAPKVTKPIPENPIKKANLPKAKILK